MIGSDISWMMLTQRLQGRTDLYHQKVGNTYCAFRKSKDGDPIESALDHVYNSKGEDISVMVKDND
jgi:hypothetical protein